MDQRTASVGPAESGFTRDRKTSSKKPKIKFGSLGEWWYGTEGHEQIGLPFTQTPHQFFEWLMYLGLLEGRIMGVVTRLTFGWHRKWTRPLTVSELCRITSHSKPLVLVALDNLREHGILDRRRISRRQPYCYGVIVRDDLLELKEVPPPVKQRTLPYNVQPLSGKENLTTEPPSEVKETLPLSGKENLTTEPPVLICIKESNTHKETYVSKFSREDRISHQKAHGFSDGWLYNSEDGRYDWLIEKERKERNEAQETKEARGQTIFERLRSEKKAG